MGFQNNDLCKSCVLQLRTDNHFREQVRSKRKQFQMQRLYGQVRNASKKDMLLASSSLFKMTLIPKKIVRQEVVRIGLSYLDVWFNYIIPFEHSLKEKEKKNTKENVQISTSSFLNDITNITRIKQSTSCF